MGPRGSEGFGLKWQDLDFERKIVSFRQGFVAGRVTLLKTDASQAEVSMPEDVLNALLACERSHHIGRLLIGCESQHQGQAAVLAGVHVEVDHPADAHLRGSAGIRSGTMPNPGICRMECSRNLDQHLNPQLVYFRYPARVRHSPVCFKDS